MTGNLNLTTLIVALQKFIADCDDSDKLYGLDGAMRDLSGHAENRAIELDLPLEVGKNQEWFVTKIRRAIEDSNDMDECDIASGMLQSMAYQIPSKMKQLGPK